MKKLIFIVPIIIELLFVNMIFVNCESPTTSKAHKAKTTNNTLGLTTANVYMENSGSMFGYFHPGDVFSTVIGDLLTNIKISGLATNINQYYISDDVFLQNGNNSDYIKNASVHNAKTFKGGSNTNISKMIEQSLSTVDETSISIFISDCIFSLGKTPAEQYIEEERNKISVVVKNQIDQKKDLAVIAYRYVSPFTGTFYDPQDHPTQLNKQKRPFFVWVFGTRNNVTKFCKEIKVDQMKVKPTHTFSFIKPISSVRFAVQNSASNSYRRVDSKSINKAKLYDGKLKINLMVDFSKLAILGDTYICNTDNYYCSNSNYKVVKVQKKAGAGMTHLITVETTKKVSAATLTIKLKNRPIDGWVSKYNVIKMGTSIHTQLGQTFGILHIFEGFDEAFNYKKQPFATMNININK